MKKYLRILIPSLFFTITVSANSGEPSQEKGFALVYKGHASCDGCSEPASEIAKKLGLKIKYVTPGHITPEVLKNAVVYIQPGGPDEIDMKKAFTKDDIKNIRSYVANGGRYWGICAGGYIAGKTIDDRTHVAGLNLFQGVAYEFSESPKARMESILWQKKRRLMYFQNGPAFKLKSGSRVESIANYKDGSLAAFISSYAKGKVGVVGPHPEADKSWLKEDHLTDPDGSDDDLGVQMLSKIISKTPVNLNYQEPSTSRGALKRAPVEVKEN
jgi:glutamine amidotransferase-like uncharacterized protein